MPVLPVRSIKETAPTHSHIHAYTSPQAAQTLYWPGPKASESWCAMKIKATARGAPQSAFEV